MAGITVGHADDLTLPLAEGHQFVRLFAAEAQRLFTHHVQPGLQRRPTDGIVSVIRRGNRHGLNTVRAGSLAAKQTLVIGVTACGIDPQLLTELAPAIGINIKGAGQQRKGVIAQGGRAVNIADLAAAAAADHAPAQGAVERS